MKAALLLIALLLSRASALTCFSFCFCTANPVPLPGSPFRRSFREAALVTKAKVRRLVSVPTFRPPPSPSPTGQCLPCLPPAPPSARALLPCCGPCPFVRGVFVYEVRVKRVFKGAASGTIRIMAKADTDEGCGIRLKVGSTYLLMANQFREVSRCLVSREWKNVGKKDKKFLRNCAGKEPEKECTVDPFA